MLKDPTLYLALAVAGVIAPYWAFLPWIADNGFSPALFVREAFGARISSFAWIDLIISAVALLAAAAGALPSKRVAAVAAATLLAGVSAGLPLFFYFHFKAETAAGSGA